MPKPKSSDIIVGITKDGNVVLGVPRPGDILFTPEQARRLGNILIASANSAERGLTLHA